MVEFTKEFLCEVVQEIEPLLQVHYQEITGPHEQLAVSPRWGDYAALEQMGFFHVFAARHQSELVGYGTFFLNKHFHHAGTTVAVSDALYLAPQHRGAYGLRLIRFCESELKRLGADKVCIHAKQESNLHLILERLGYGVEEVTLSKTLKEK